ncbi:MAG TPA: F0F1 ATP synthase subunit B [Candidatus Paceibacterota bacterium]|nr:F0F1 ATP synthase subunit B [Candidatus Paceibacterota bacterium]
MEEILHAFGINGKLIVIQIINFAILASVLTYFLYNPILKILSEREAKIKKGLEDAKNAEQALARADIQKNQILSTAHQEAEAISVRAKQYAEATSQTSIDEAHHKAKLIIEGAETRSREIQKNAQKESEAEIVKTAILMAEKILREKNV